MTPLEQKQLLLALRAEITALRDRVGALEARITPPGSHYDLEWVQVDKKARKMCPHCGEVPAKHFHVINCAKNKNKGVNGSNGP